MPPLTQQRLRELFNYDPETGLFTRLVRCSRMPAGSVSGCLDSHGYVMFRVDYTIHRAHRLVWLYVHGELPPEHIDHINGIPTDNRLCNLRLATNSENMQNKHRLQRTNTSGVNGVHWHQRGGKWQARIKINYKYISLGLFDTIEEAAAARLRAEALYHPFSPRSPHATAKNLAIPA